MFLSLFRRSVVDLKHLVSRAMSSCSIQTAKFAYVNFTEENDRLHLSFKYSANETVERQYNFNRSSTEQVGSVLARIALNISSREEKKVRRKKQKQKDDNAPGDPQDSPTELAVCLEYEGRSVPADATNYVAWKDGSILQIGQQRYSIAVNTPTIKNARLPKVIMAGFPVHPQVELENADLYDCKAIWYKSTLRGEHFPTDEVRRTHNKSFFNTHECSLSITPTVGDIGRYLFVILTPCVGEKQGMPVEVVSTTTVTTGPEYCPFDSRHCFTASYTDPGKFRCMSYNLLADAYADSKFAKTVLFSYCPEHALDIAYRKQLLIKEILGYKTDLMFLQEVDRRMFSQDLEPILRSHGYCGSYTEKKSPMAEGVACFFRGCKFRAVDGCSKLLSSALVDEPALADIKHKIAENARLLARFVSRPTAFQVLLLEPLEKPGRLLLVANTHLYYHPDSDHIRLLQAYCCIRLLEWLRREYSERFGVVPAVIFAGDFNSCPAFGVYQLLTSGSVSEDCEDWCSNADEAVSGLRAVQKIPLASACGVPVYTNYTPNFKGCLDYIFYDYEQLLREEMVPMPPQEEIEKHEGLPSILFPSDHVAQVATLRWV
ncbi:2',5'-phosphodiesterase 12 [Ixodes scapularis]